VTAAERARYWATRTDAHGPVATPEGAGLADADWQRGWE
jgi:hypothetical protein